MRVYIYYIIALQARGSGPADNITMMEGRGLVYVCGGVAEGGSHHDKRCLRTETTARRLCVCVVVSVRLADYQCLLLFLVVVERRLKIFAEVSDITR